MKKEDKYPRWWNTRFNNEEHFIHYSGNYWWSKQIFKKISLLLKMKIKNKDVEKIGTY